MPKQSYKNVKSRSQPKRRLPFIILGLAILVALVLGLELTNTTHLFHHAKPPVAAGQNTKGEPTTGSGSTTTNGSPTSTTPTTPTTSNDKSGQPVNPNATLIEPTGNFVSAHHNIPLSADLSSVCNTTPGASCTISFTRDGVVKSLPKKTTDANGAAFWESWKPADIGLTPGSWAISATATMNNTSKTTSDSLELTVSQ